MKPALAEEQWKYDAIPQDEIEACYLHEYSREYFNRSKTLQSLYAAWEAYQRWLTAHKHKKPLRVPEKHTLGLLASDYAERILAARLGYSVPIDFRTFPNLSWQELRERPRREAWPVRHGKGQAAERRRKREYPADRLHMDTLAQLEPANIKSLPTWIHCHQWFRRGQDLSNTEYGFFAINWEYPLCEIQRAARDWLERRARERRHEPKPGSPSRGQARDKLRWLGALRVKNHYRFSELVQDRMVRSDIDAPYSYYPDLSAAAKKAENLLTQMFPSEKEARNLLSQPLEEPLKEPASLLASLAPRR